MDDREIMDSFIGKEISEVRFKPRFELELIFSDGSTLIVENDGLCGSTIKVSASVKVTKTM
ncbi:hypothetical protein HMPREF0322_00425 [Desulfitobacterium hafniense DP7]|uniref:Uncharacterized protein n=1 Tax=Desulfitobacterium hafniense DP7 TaxID=537010 RepID=G9XHK0_DESHA|nr:hypothetical protein [Desulfitobacterium hafniense]EHL08783.1 hypothetical protein HMPREF0322_00425 [Desulfitobacterium hafniense DP7]